MTQPEKQLCFLVGAPRSGTTWIQRLLQSHPAICGGEESYFFALFAEPMRSADKMLERGQGPLHYLDRTKLEDALRGVWMRIFSDLYDHNPNSIVHLEKTPFHAIFLDEIILLFPNAKIIFLTRDSRAVTSSLVYAARGWGAQWAPDTYRGAALEWYRHVRSVLDWRGRNPDHPFLEVQYEHALQDTHEELERMLRFVLPDTTEVQVDATLQIFEHNQSKTQDPEGFSRKRGAAGWKTDMSLYGKFVTWRYTRKLMRELGYDISILD